MGERKVLNKYYPPDFDPEKIFRRKQPKNHQIKVRTMLPMSIRCNSCGNYMYQGTKFNCRKEDVTGEMYLGFQNFRFYFKCTHCCAEFTIKTDYKNSDYVVEGEATRNFEPWRDQDEGLERQKRRRVLGDAMESLENRTLELKREMDKIAAIDELKSLKSRQETVRVEQLLESIRRRDQEKEGKPMAEEDEAIIRSLFHGTDDDDDDDDDRDEAANSSAKRFKVSEEPADRKSIFPSLIRRVVAKRKPVHLAEDKEPKVNADSKDDQRHGRSTLSVLQPLCDITVKRKNAALLSLRSQWRNTPPSWRKSDDPCGGPWEGVICSNSRVVVLTLSSMGLKGLLPGDIGDLSELISLDFSFNRDLTGPVSARLGDLKKLSTLILAGCGFNGNIPPELGNLSELNFLALNSNNFTGEIPGSIGNLSKVHWLHLADNQLSGSILVSTPSAPGLDRLWNAKHFHFNKNKLSGSIPSQLFCSDMTLIHVIFDGNQLTGSIPSTLGLVKTLEVVRLDRNSLTGEVPLNLNNLTRVSELREPSSQETNRSNARFNRDEFSQLRGSEQQQL